MSANDVPKLNDPKGMAQDTTLHHDLFLLHEGIYDIFPIAMLDK